MVGTVLGGIVNGNSVVGGSVTIKIEGSPVVVMGSVVVVGGSVVVVGAGVVVQQQILQSQSSQQGAKQQQRSRG